MSKLKPTPRDSNYHFLTGHGSELFTKRFASVDTTGSEIFLEVDCKSVVIHKEGSTNSMIVVGGASGSAAAYITTDGSSLEGIDVALPGSVSAWSDSLGTAIDLADYTIRQEVTPDRDGNYIRLTFEAQSGQAMAADNVAIVEQSSGATGTGIPTEVLFQGGSGFSISAGATIVSDELNFPVKKNTTYLVIFDDAGTGQVNHSTTGGEGYYKKAASNSYDTAALAGATTVASATACIVNLGVSKEPTTICTVQAPSSTIGVSVFAWR